MTVLYLQAKKYSFLFSEHSLLLNTKDVLWHRPFMTSVLAINSLRSMPAYVTGVWRFSDFQLSSLTALLS